MLLLLPLPLLLQLLRLLQRLLLPQSILPLPLVVLQALVPLRPRTMGVRVLRDGRRRRSSAWQEARGAYGGHGGRICVGPVDVLTDRSIALVYHPVYCVCLRISANTAAVIKSWPANTVHD